MEIIPAIDLRGGKCVRLYQGDFSQEMVFSDDPVAVARRWAELGAPRLHIVDLDGARAGHLIHGEVIGNIARAMKIPLQVGGGLRSLEAVAEVLSLGAERAVLGTAAVEEPKLVKKACQKFGERVVVGIDARDGMVAARGWEKQTSMSALELAERLGGMGVKSIVSTDIAQDGTLAGPGFQDIARLLALPGFSVIASGGISTLEHVARLRDLGVEGAILGRALYTGQLDLKEAIAVASRPMPPPPHHRFDVRRLSLLEDVTRRRELNPEKVFDLLPLEPQQRVADIGCGPGYFSLPLARRLPQGQVVALDVQPEMLARLRERAKRARIKNIDIMKCGEVEFPLELGGLDGMLLTFVLHEMKERAEEFLKIAAALLKPGGWLAIVEWVKASTGDGPPRADRLSQEETEALAEKVGLKVVREEGLGDKYYFLLAHRPTGGDSRR
ncbi:MAG: 1-(5-phosphoribosyl)-5-[(5-phosphoribosylamino)methylideneamino]imidazole-4-carboxamide isomerase [Chloroflexi bacterium]|nr:1-(5-phosphoribosyl)-5-[(5-phosphoribosylamino)methylideneamino]imidazole-4-carboxamide isomerase [Chloroflexota bacterium]